MLTLTGSERRWREPSASANQRAARVHGKYPDRGRRIKIRRTRVGKHHNPVSEVEVVAESQAIGNVPHVARWLSGQLPLCQAERVFV